MPRFKRVAPFQRAIKTATLDVSERRIGRQDLWAEPAWSPVFSRLLACGISRRLEQPGSATIIR